MRGLPCVNGQIIARSGQTRKLGGWPIYVKNAVPSGIKLKLAGVGLKNNRSFRYNSLTMAPVRNAIFSLVWPLP